MPSQTCMHMCAISWDSREFAYYCVMSLYTWHHIPLKVHVWDTYAFCHCCAVAYIGSLIWLGKSILVLKLQQKASTRHVYEGKDVFVWLSTAFRKIICYEALPFWLQRYHWAISINVRRLLHPELKGFTPWVLSIGPDIHVGLWTYDVSCVHMPWWSVAYILNNYMRTMQVLLGPNA